MNFVDLKRIKLSVIHDGTTYSKEFYVPATQTEGIIVETYPNWNEEETYSVGAYVIVPQLKSIYKSSSNNNTGIFPPSNSSYWTFWGFTNDMSMFTCDEKLGSQTKGTNAVITIPFNQSNVLAIIDTDFSSVNVKQIDNDTNEVIKDLDITSRDISCSSFAEYCFKKTLLQRKIIIKNLEWYPNSNIVLTFDGECKIGTIGMGLLEELGITLLGTSLEWESRSKIKIDDFTEYRSVIRYGKVRVLNVQVLFNIDEFNRTALKIDSILDKNILFVPTEQDNFSEMISIGYIEKFKLPVDNPNKILTTTSIVGVVN
ncbi:MAG: hypothetical protein AB7D41_03590 [Arcobacter sp.]|uniref:hypothetical protein n=1 Tax=Arcobacter sp. TaxID=1872629 RepID=UPI003D070A3E